MSRAHELWERYRRGEAVRLGDEVVLSQDSLQVHDLSVGLNTLLVPRLGDDGGLVIGQIGAPQPLLVVPATALEDVQAALEVLGRIVNEVPYLERRSVTGWPPGSVGDVSAQIGYDVRDLRMAGFGDDAIDRVLRGEISVEDLLERGPDKTASDSVMAA